MPETQRRMTARFGLFELDAKTRELHRDGRIIRLQKQPFDLLTALIEQPGQIVSREALRERLWAPDTFVDFDQGLNKSVRKLREALGDSADSPRYIETIQRIGYRFIAPVEHHAMLTELEAPTEQESPVEQKPPAEPPTPFLARPPFRSSWSALLWSGALLILVGVAGGWSLYFRQARSSPVLKYEQLTDFNDPVLNPVLSPDGRLLAFMRGESSFGTSGFIYVKILPNGDAKLICDDPRPKYNLAFSPDASRIAYTVFDSDGFSTFSVPTLGGEPRLVLKNAAGLSWLGPHQYLFSRIRSGLHLGIVTTNDVGENLRELYYPAHERGMAHYSFASPDHAFAIVVEMNEQGGWAPCKLIDLHGSVLPRNVGPPGPCTYAGWSPDGSTMFFIATTDDRSHLWSQRLGDGTPQQITNDPSEEEGLAVEASGRSIITSIGLRASAVWIHSPTGEQALSSEGQVIGDPAFSRDTRSLYFLLQQRNTSGGPELWRSSVGSRRGELVLPGVAMTSFDISPDESQVVYTAGEGRASQLWIASLNGSSQRRNLDVSGATWPHFGPQRKIFLVRAEGDRNFLEQVNEDGSERTRVSSDPVIEITSISPGQRWLIASIPGSVPGEKPGIAALDLREGPPLRLFAGYCVPRWSSDGKLLSIPVEPSSATSPGRSLLIPVGPGETLPPLPSAGLRPNSEPAMVPGSKVYPRADFIPGRGSSTYAYVKSQEHRNLYRVTLPVSHP